MIKVGTVNSYYKSKFTLPVPGNVASGQDITNLAKDLLHVNAERERCIELLAFYIADVDKFAPSSWWILATDYSIDLVVGHQTLVSIGAGGIGVTLDSETLSASEITDLQKYMAPKFWSQDDDGTITVWIFAIHVKNFLDPVRRSSANLLSRLASRGDLSECCGIMHSAGAIEYLNKYLGMDIPDPANFGRIANGHRLHAAFASHGLDYSNLQMSAFYTALQSKGVVILSGISGTGKTKLIQHFAAMLPGPTDESSNHLFLSVRPDWRDSKALLGYFNPLTEAYAWTPFLRFLERAARSFAAGDGLA